MRIGNKVNVCVIETLLSPRLWQDTTFPPFDFEALRCAKRKPSDPVSHSPCPRGMDDSRGRFGSACRSRRCCGLKRVETGEQTRQGRRIFPREGVEVEAGGQEIRLGKGDMKCRVESVYKVSREGSSGVGLYSVISTGRVSKFVTR